MAQRKSEKPKKVKRMGVKLKESYANIQQRSAELIKNQKRGKK